MYADDRIPRIIDNLYSGVLDPTAWRNAMLGIADLVSGAAVMLLCVNPSTATILRDEFFRGDADEYKKYRQHWIGRDIRIAPSLSAQVGQPIFESKLMPVQCWTGSEIFNDYLAPNDSPWFLGFLLHKAPDKVVNFSINSSRLRGPFDEKDGERLRPIVGHLRRAIEIKDRLEMVKFRADAIGKSLDSVSFGVMILDSQGHALEVSARARQILRNGSEMRLSADGSLSIRAPAGPAFRQWIKDGRPPEANPDGLLRVPRPLGQALSLMLTRLPEQTTSWMNDGPPCWLLLIFDPDLHINLATEMIARDLGISPRESEVAALLADGYDLVEIARQLHLSVNTVRNHLKAIFAKTGIRSQSLLLKRVTSGPAQHTLKNESRRFI